MRKLFFVLAVNIAIGCTVLVCLELTGQVAHHLQHGKFVFEDNDNSGSYRSYLNSLFEQHPYLAGRLRKDVRVERSGYVFQTTERNTRWTGAPQNDETLIRIAVLGGSTTYGTGVADKNSWPALLQKKLGEGFSVINYGVPGYSTAEAIIQLALTVPEAKPHFIIHYQGWNDIRNYHDPVLGVDYYGHGMKQYGNLAIPSYKKKTVLEKFEEVSAVVQYAHEIKLRFSPQPVEPTPRVSSLPDPFVDRIYVRNLETIKVLSENMTSFSLFVPQVLNYPKFIEKEGSYAWSPHIDNKAMPELMDRFNLLMKSVCPDDETGCIFVERVLQEQWEPDDFVDNGHFSPKGGDKFAEILSNVILGESTKESTYLQVQ